MKNDLIIELGRSRAVLRDPGFQTTTTRGVQCRLFLAAFLEIPS